MEIRARREGRAAEYKSMPEEELAELANQTKDEKMLGLYLEKMKPLLATVINRKLQGRSRNDVDEILQITSISVLEAFRAGKIKLSTPLMIRIAERKAVDFLRGKKGRHFQRTVEATLDSLTPGQREAALSATPGAVREKNAEEVLIENSDKKQLKKAIETVLSPKQKEVINLLIFGTKDGSPGEPMKQVEIAKMLGVTQGNITQHRDNAKKAIAEYFENIDKGLDN